MALTKTPTAMSMTPPAAHHRPFDTNELASGDSIRSLGVGSESSFQSSSGPPEPAGPLARGDGALAGATARARST
jgi:hypothetical protein